jgi:hypothetical protein
MEQGETDLSSLLQRMVSQPQLTVHAHAGLATAESGGVHRPALSENFIRLMWQQVFVVPLFLLFVVNGVSYIGRQDSTFA